MGTQIAKTILETISNDRTKCYHQIPVANAKALQEYIANENSETIVAEYQKDQEVVSEGVITEQLIKDDVEYNYAQVPLGLVLRGSLVVIKAGKGVKTLGPGDFMGLFETSDWLLTKRSRQIGDWTLMADTDCEIMFFSSSLLLRENVTTSNFRNYLIELARADHVPQPISALPLLDWVASHTTRSRLVDCAIVVHTHLLTNSIPFFRHLSHLVAPGQIYILEKPYSTIKAVFNELVKSGYDVTKVYLEQGMPYEFATQKSTEVLWRKVVQSQKKNGFKKILVVDDGGDLWLTIPWKELEGVEITGVEQTQRGITRIQRSSIKTPPIVSVASSGVKKLIESEFIGISVVNKLDELGAISASKQIGILGLGSIGGAIQRALQKIGRTALCYDTAYHSSTTMPENGVNAIDRLMNKCDLIIGTVGSDSIIGTALERVSGTKILASASSADVEFGSLLKLAEQSEDVFATQKVKVHENLELKILNGGYPINFDRTKDTTPDEDIVLTRCLLYIGAMQAAYLLSIHEQNSGIYDLDKISQRHLLEHWLEYKKELLQTHHVKTEDVSKIVHYSTLENAKNTPSVWED